MGGLSNQLGELQKRLNCVASQLKASFTHGHSKDRKSSKVHLEDDEKFENHPQLRKEAQTAFHELQHTIKNVKKAFKAFKAGLLAFCMSTSSLSSEFEAFKAQCLAERQ